MFETPEEYRQRVGRIEIGRSYEYETRGNVVTQFVVALLLLAAVVGVAVWLIWPFLPPLLIGVPALAAYCALSYFVRVHPNHDHVTQRFGEQRWSDDVNWFLILLVIVFAPGRFISVGIVDGVRLLARGRLPHEGPGPGAK